MVCWIDEWIDGCIFIWIGGWWIRWMLRLMDCQMTEWTDRWFIWWMYWLDVFHCWMVCLVRGWTDGCWVFWLLSGGMDGFICVSRDLLPFLPSCTKKLTNTFNDIPFFIYFFKQETFQEMIEDAGFFRVQYTNLSGGIVALHSGFKLWWLSQTHRWISRCLQREDESIPYERKNGHNAT